MTDLSPEMREQLEALKRDDTQQYETWLDMERARLDRNRNAVERLAQDARALGQIALQRGREPYTSLDEVTIVKKGFGRSEQRIRKPVLQGWALTWKHIIGLPPYEEASAKGRTTGFITMIGTDCNLYVAETSGVNATTGITNTAVISGGLAYENPSTSHLALASTHYAQLGHTNPAVLSPNSTEFVLENINVEAIRQAMLIFAENKQLY